MLRGALYHVLWPLSPTSNAEILYIPILRLLPEAVQLHSKIKCLVFIWPVIVALALRNYQIYPAPNWQQSLELHQLVSNFLPRSCKWMSEETRFRFKPRLGLAKSPASLLSVNIWGVSVVLFQLDLGDLRLARGSCVSLCTLFRNHQASVL